MDDAVRMAQRLTEKGDTVLLSPAVLVLICLKIMRIEGINLNKQFTIYKGVSIFLNNNTNETASKQFKRR
jgi:hypothetical protein